MAGAASDRFRVDFARLVRRLLEESSDREAPVSGPIREHLGGGVEALPVHGEELPDYEIANLQLGLDAAFSRPGFSARILGVSGQGRMFSHAEALRRTTPLMSQSIPRPAGFKQSGLGYCSEGEANS